MYHVLYGNDNVSDNCFRTCFPTPTIEYMVSRGHCLSNINDINGKETAMVSGSQLINNFTFRQIDTPVRRMMHTFIYFFIS